MDVHSGGGWVGKPYVDVKGGDRVKKIPKKIVDVLWTDTSRERLLFLPISTRHARHSSVESN